jgi:hypothetical protein
MKRYSHIYEKTYLTYMASSLFAAVAQNSNCCSNFDAKTSRECSDLQIVELLLRHSKAGFQWKMAPILKRTEKENRLHKLLGL